MRRRSVLALTSSLVTTGLAGCSASSSSSDETDSVTSDKKSKKDVQSVRETIVQCEEHYIRTEYIPEGATQVSSITPDILEFDTRNGGTYATVETGFGYKAPAETDTPTPIVDALVTAYYYRGSDGTFRTEEPAQDPANATRVQCG